MAPRVRRITDPSYIRKPMVRRALVLVLAFSLAHAEAAADDREPRCDVPAAAERRDALVPARPAFAADTAVAGFVASQARFLPGHRTSLSQRDARQVE